ncbi:relaxase/mobilization nuclease domain-containing protein [uncultured Ruminococcus sp.]|uniref:relaxase/mobilization nuclease domain-containing protein n=1 Tax=uncultured Ruminococcus sp. TaxID=165186 RepID=UPI0025E9D0E7|nr:relaxase/mobilization nuclease domain-containing protein [uncultured Ruminococcus sp.]
MPIVHFINNKSQTSGGMRNVLAYVSKAEKTEVEDKKYVTALNCSADTAYEEFNATKNLYHKNGGRLYYHLVQSFPSGYEIAPGLAHEIAVEFASGAFSKYECVVATHIDREHIHSHIVFNSVSFEDGKKYHSDKQSVEQLMCKKFLWVQTTVKRLIQNEIYTGVLVNHKTVTSKIYKTKSVISEEERYRHEDFLPAIIDKETWKQAQILLEARQKSGARASEDKVIHRYSGMIKCAECGASLIAKKRSLNGVPYVEYSCNSYNRYGKQHCTPHRIHESQIDKLVIEELTQWREKIIAESDKYDRIVREWVRNRPIYEQKIKQYNDKILILKNQIEEIIMERIADREHAEVYNNMISKREEQIADLEKKISDCKIYDKISRERHAQLKSTAEMLDEILDKVELSDAQLRTLVRRIIVHQNEDKSLDVRLEFNGDFEDSVSVYVESETA